MSVKLHLIYRWRSDEKRVKNIAIVFNCSSSCYELVVFRSPRLFTFFFSSSPANTHDGGAMEVMICIGRFGSMCSNAHVHRKLYGYRLIRCIVINAKRRRWRSITRRGHKEKLKSGNIFLLYLCATCSFEMQYVMGMRSWWGALNVTFTSYGADEIRRMQSNDCMQR